MLLLVTPKYRDKKKPGKTGPEKYRQLENLLDRLHKDAVAGSIVQTDRSSLNFQDALGIIFPAEKFHFFARMKAE